MPPPPSWRRCIRARGGCPARRVSHCEDGKCYEAQIRPGRPLVVLVREKGPADPRFENAPDRDHHDDHEEHVELLLLGLQHPAEQLRGRHRHSHGAAGQNRGSDVGPSHQLAEREGHDGEIEQPHAPERRDARRAAGECAGEAGRNDGEPPGNAELRGEYRRRVGADAEERDVREGELAEIPDDDVESYADQYIHEDQVDDVLVVGVDEQGQGQRGERQEPEEGTRGLHRLCGPVRFPDSMRLVSRPRLRSAASRAGRRARAVGRGAPR